MGEEGKRERKQQRRKKNRPPAPLQPLASSKKQYKKNTLQLCALNITQEGLALAWQDPSKSARSSLYLGRDAFSKFDVPSSWGGGADEDDDDGNDYENIDGGRATVDLHTFADTAALFAALGGGGGEVDALELRYPGPNGAIEFEMGGASSSSSSSSFLARAVSANPANLLPSFSSPSSSSRTYARVGTADSDPASVVAAAAAAAEDAAAAAASRALRGGSGNGGENSRCGGGGGGCSVFIAPSPLLREAVSDLEWAAGTGGGGGGSGGGASSSGGTVALTLVRDPPRASLSATCVGGSLAIELPPSALASFAVGGPLVRHGYRFRHLRAALAPPFSANAGSGGGGGSAAAAGGGKHGSSRASAAGGAGGEPPPPPASSKVAVDPSGVLRVTHIVPLRGYSSTGASSNNAVIQFVMYSCVEEEDEEEGEEGLGNGGSRGALAAVSDNEY